MTHFLRFFWTVFLIVQLLPTAHAVQTDQAEVTLISTQNSLKTGQKEAVFGLEFQLKEGWKIYWRAPGAGGKPPALHWQEESDNVAALTIQWPFPKRFQTYGLLSNGYANHVILPLKVTRQDTNQGIDLAITVDFFICNTICIPDQVRVHQSLANADGAYNASAQRIFAAQQTVPKTQNSLLAVSKPEILQGHGNVSRLRWVVNAPNPVRVSNVFFDAPEAEFSEPVLEFTTDRKQFSISVEAKYLKSNSDIALVLATDIDGFSRHEFTGVHAEGLLGVGYCYWPWLGDC